MYVLKKLCSITVDLLGTSALANGKPRLKPVCRRQEECSNLLQTVRPSTGSSHQRLSSGFHLPLSSSHQSRTGKAKRWTHTHVLAPSGRTSIQITQVILLKERNISALFLGQPNLTNTYVLLEIMVIMRPTLF